MMNLSLAFLTQSRKYIQLEKRLGASFDEAELAISAREQQRLILGGMSPEDAAALVNGFWLRERGKLPEVEDPQ